MAESLLQAQLDLSRHINRYGWLADTFAWSDIESCFTEDCEFNFKVPADLEGKAPMNLVTGSIQGRSNTAKTFAAISDRFPRTQHNILNMDFDIDSSCTTASGRANIFWAGVTDDNGRYYTVQNGCRYTWKFVKNAQSGRWETSYTEVEVVWVSSAPVSGYKLVNMV